MNELETTSIVLALLSWMGVSTIAILVALGRIQVRLSQQSKSVDRLWKEFDRLHPRRANPGHRVGVNHHHEREE